MLAAEIVYSLILSQKNVPKIDIEINYLRCHAVDMNGLGKRQANSKPISCPVEPRTDALSVVEVLQYSFLERYGLVIPITIQGLGDFAQNPSYEIRIAGPGLRDLIGGRGLWSIVPEMRRVRDLGPPPQNASPAV